MFDQFDSTQPVADQLLRMLSAHRAADPAQHAEAVSLLHDFEAATWNPGAFAHADASAATHLQVDEDGRLHHAPQDGGTSLLGSIVTLLKVYLVLVGADTRHEYSTEEAATYLGLSVPLVKYHIHTSKRLKGRKVGHSLVFTQVELEAFRAQERKVGRPKKPRPG